MLNRLSIRSLPRTFAALAMLAALLLGSVGHAWHHYVDRDCDTHTGASASPCGVCAGLHAAQVQGDLQAARIPAPVMLSTVVYAQVKTPEAAQVRAAGARAPPQA
jgi:hypothetical protein